MHTSAVRDPWASFRAAVRWVFWLALLQAGISAACAQSPQPVRPAPREDASVVIHMLDYVSVDYPEVVKDGRVLDAAEYEEQLEFARKSLAGLQQLPEAAGKPQAVASAQKLVGRIEAKAPGAEIAMLSRNLAADVMRVWSVAVAPRQAPDGQRAIALYRAQCVACHGAEGRGDGAAANGLDPRPSNFHDAARMDKRSLYGLYSTITLGVQGTAMRGFGELSESDRWALAFLVGGMRDSPQQRAAGESLWKRGVGHRELGSLQSLVTAVPAEVAQTGGPDLAAVRAFLVSHPQAIASAGAPPLTVARTQLKHAGTAYASGDRSAARQHAITAYLEGFELVETSLDNVDQPLRVEIEKEMMALRAGIDAAVPAQEIESRIAHVEALLQRAHERLDGESLSSGAAFTSSLLILVREGLEAILVLAAIIGFVQKTGRRDALPYIHLGWAVAGVLGVLTWLVSSRVLAISGASREVTEGVSAVVASVMLLYVGAWLHRRSHAQAWQSFIRDKVNAALGRRTLWAMAGISFLAVYRELFEIVLFYQALWAQAGPEGSHAVVAGLVAGAALLAVLGWAILRFGRRLPLPVFFGFTTALLVVMAVVFIGHGVAALQEAGILGITPAGSVALPWLGVHPTLQGLCAQAVVIGLVVFEWLRTRPSRASTTA